MEDVSELEQKIAGYEALLNSHQAQPQVTAGSQYNTSTSSASHYTAPASSYYHGEPYHYPQYPQYSTNEYYDGYGSKYGYHGASSWAQQPGTPYGIPRGSTRGRYGRHYNRTLVMNRGASSQSSGAMPSTDVGSTQQANTTAEGSQAYVSRRGRNLQLISTTMHKRGTQEVLQAKEAARKRKLELREASELQTVQQQFSSAAAPARYQPITIHGVDFVMSDNGNKLTRVGGEGKSRYKTYVGGVKFLRADDNNLYRAGYIEAMRGHQPHKLDTPCPTFSNTGICPEGDRCKKKHDPTRTAVCKTYLLTGECRAGARCDLSHDLTPQRVPVCMHFLHGNCNNAGCRFAHVNTNPAAPICRPFAILGFCQKGDTCMERHLRECPDYTNKGICTNKDCRLKHVAHAGQLRAVDEDVEMESDYDDSSSEDDSESELLTGLQVPEFPVA